VDLLSFQEHCKWLVDQGAGLAIFGTNSEANSISPHERSQALRALLDAGINPKNIMVGSGTCSIPETVQLTREAVENHCEGALILPPYFYKNISDDGLYDYFARVIDAVGSDELRIYLYHIPQFTGVPITPGVVERLLKSYPKIIAGIKDSSGDWSNTEQFLSRFPGIDIFPSSEALLEKALPLGAAGCISATANVQPKAIASAIGAYGTTAYPQRQRTISAVRKVVQDYPMVGALKRIVAQRTGEKTWAAVRPPLTPLQDEPAGRLMRELAAAGFQGA
jgi:4-hydroxy-tetrahydrodipicolinate synthase